LAHNLLAECLSHRSMKNTPGNYSYHVIVVGSLLGVPKTLNVLRNV
jgi:hypothetical protein